MADFVPIIFVAIIAIGIGMFAFISLNSRKQAGLNKQDFINRWQNIEKSQAQGGAAWTLAVIEADKLLDSALRMSGHPGETLGDRLKGARGVFRNEDDVWQAHKLRNRIAHEQDIRLNQFSVDKALKQFKSALKDLGAL